jgi:hypothetical protein
MWESTGRCVIAPVRAANQQSGHENILEEMARLCASPHIGASREDLTWVKHNAIRSGRKHYQLLLVVDGM